MCSCRHTCVYTDTGEDVRCPANHCLIPQDRVSHLNWRSPFFQGNYTASSLQQLFCVYLHTNAGVYAPKTVPNSYVDAREPYMFCCSHCKLSSLWC